MRVQTVMRVGHNRGPGVGRHLDFGHDGYVTLCGITDQLANIVLSVKPARMLTAGSLTRAATAHSREIHPRTNLRQLWVLLNLDTPALVVSQVNL
ncbi:hypothetical protein ES707_09502 [subsurface metagenome]